MGKVLSVFFALILFLLSFFFTPSVKAQEVCSLDPASPPVYSEADWAVFIIDIKDNKLPGVNDMWKMEFVCGGRLQHVDAGRVSDNKISASILRSRKPWEGCEFHEGTHTIKVKKIVNNKWSDHCQDPVEYTVIKGSLPKPSTTPSLSGGLGCDIDPTTPGIQTDPAKPGIATAIGCIHTNPDDLIADVLKFAIGIGGGLAFLMMLLGAFQMLTSAGNPETLAAGKDRLTSAVIGLLFVIFAVLLLQIIGVDILGLPGFGR